MEASVSVSGNRIIDGFDIIGWASTGVLFEKP